MLPDVKKSLNEARSLAEQGRHGKARSRLLELLKEDPNNQVALLMLGGSYFIEEKYSEAGIVFERLILIVPGEGKYSIALLNTLWKLGRIEEALEEIKRFVSVADSDEEREIFDQYMQITDLIAFDVE